jgi:hypothetical protein
LLKINKYELVDLLCKTILSKNSTYKTMLFSLNINNIEDAIVSSDTESNTKYDPRSLDPTSLRSNFNSHENMFKVAQVKSIPTRK